MKIYLQDLSKSDESYVFTYDDTNLRYTSWSIQLRLNKYIY